MSKEIVLIIFDLFKTKGSNLQYGNENVTQLEHALQCAELTEQSNHSKEIITAALLHDIGDEIAPLNHSELAAAVLKPFVSEKTAWINHSMGFV